MCLVAFLISMLALILAGLSGNPLQMTRVFIVRIRRHCDHNRVVGHKVLDGITCGSPSIRKEKNCFILIAHLEQKKVFKYISILRSFHHVTSHNFDKTLVSFRLQ